MDCAVSEGLRECAVDQLVLLDQREAAKTRAVDRHMEVVATARPVHDRNFGRVGEGLLDQVLESVAAQGRFVTVRDACIPSLR